MDESARDRGEAWRERLEAMLRRRIEAADLPGELQDAALYAALSPGKRLRPLLTLHSCELVGGAARRALPAAAAVEMIHAFSLVHDDLPAVDNDELRRGLPTVHVKFGEALAILAGDLLSSLAFATLAEEIDDPAVAARLSGELAAATNAMIAGQVYDTFGSFAPGLSARERLELIHRKKTGALIRCACRLGAICGNADDNALSALTAFGEALGLLFQITDDLLDVTASTDAVGKRTGKDTSAGKTTYPQVLGLAEARAEVHRLEASALAVLAPFGAQAEPLRELCSAVAVRTK